MSELDVVLRRARPMRRPNAPLGWRQRQILRLLKIGTWDPFIDLQFGERDLPDDFILDAPCWRYTDLCRALYGAAYKNPFHAANLHRALRGLERRGLIRILWFYRGNRLFRYFGADPQKGIPGDYRKRERNRRGFRVIQLIA